MNMKASVKTIGKPQIGDILSIHRCYSYGQQTVYSGECLAIRDDGAIVLSYLPHAGARKRVTGAFPTDPSWLGRYQVSSQTVTVATV